MERVFLCLCWTAVALGSVSGPACTFDNGFCDWTQPANTKFKWKLGAGKTSSPETGPESDVSGTGKYIYIDASSETEGDRAKLGFRGHSTGDICLRFFYHMYGTGVKTINIYNSGKLVWSTSGNQGNRWIQAEVTLSGNYHLVLEGVRGSSSKGDIAIDDITVTRGSCKNSLIPGGCKETTPASLTTTMEKSTTQLTTAPTGMGCGISQVSRVIGGQDSKPGNWPWQVGLHKLGRFICGGSLVSRSWVVTAAHCVTQNTPGYYFVRLGDNNRIKSEGAEQDIKVKRIVSHPKYGRPRLNNDIALLELIKPAMLNPRVGLVCLPPQDYRVPLNSTCYITGWGKIQHPGASHHILQQANMDPISQAECRLKNDKTGIHITPQMLCAGKPGSILSACHGDSGGPYVCYHDGRWVLQGAVSWGSGSCDAKRVYTVLASVSNYRTWINKYIGVPPTPSVPSSVAPSSGPSTSPQTRPRPQTTMTQTTSPRTPSIQIPECSNYKTLDDADRSMTYNSSVPLKCDRRMSGWYRFSGAAGTGLPTSCVTTHHCSTHAPGWLKDLHPTTSQGAQRVQVCFHWSSDCCLWSTMILARNCGGFYVYQLKEPPGCFLRYCGNGNQGSSAKPPKTETTKEPKSPSPPILTDAVTTTPPVPATTTRSPSLPPSFPPIPMPLCGFRPYHGRIVGGNEAKINSWPWQAMLRKTSGIQFCGGSLVHIRWVLTAAHCVEHASTSSFFVRLGAHYRKTSIPTEQDIKISKIIIHPNYNPLTLTNDIALLKLVMPAKLGIGVDLVCLGNSKHPLPIGDKSKKCFITGWGKLSSGGSQPNALMQALVPLVPKKTCLKGYPGKIDDTMLCAGHKEGGVDACQGDSGGPLVCDYNHHWFLEGVTSWGHGCAEAGKYGVYAKVRYFDKWIEKTMSHLSSTAVPNTRTPTASSHQSKPATPPSFPSTTKNTVPPATSAKPSSAKPRSTPVPEKCGKSPVNSRVIGGQNSKPGNWPWQVGLHKRGRFICGGSLISHSWVVTAAHCVTNNMPSDYFVRLGDNNRIKSEGSEQDIKVKRIISHPQYGRPRLNNDIALLELIKPAMLNPRVGLVCLPPQNYNVALSASCYITGWGKIQHPGSSHHILQQAKMGLISQAECRLKNHKTGIQITPQMLCAGKPGSILSGCHGDSGGPYVCYHDDRWVLQGAVSWGSGSCDAKSVYTVFACVSKFRTWINKYIGVLPTPPVQSSGPTSGSSTPETPKTTPLKPQTTIKATKNPSKQPIKIPECSNYKTLDDANRSMTYNKSVPLKCDRRMSDSWYRFSGASGTQLPTSCVPTQHCSTHAPGWLRDPHPTIHQGAQRVQVCFHWSSDCCRWSTMILARNCGDFYVYQLKKPPACFLRYCGARPKERPTSKSTMSSQTTEVPTTPAPFPPGPISVCDFDQGLCYGWSQSKVDTFNWRNHRGRTPSYNTGPSNGHGGSGKYMYIEASRPRQRGDTADLLLRVPDNGKAACLTFFYHMHGASIGDLYIFSGTSRVFRKTKDQGNLWKKAQVTIYLNGVVKFHAVRGRSWTGDIAIDDVLITPGSCLRQSPSPEKSTPEISALLGPCGISHASSVLGGAGSAQGRWPWQIALLSGHDKMFTCGGSLIAPDWVLTAAHCIKMSAKDYTIRVGDYNRYVNDGTEEDIQAKRIIVHSGYDKPRLNNDIALIQLSRAVTQSRSAGTVCLPSQDEFVPVSSTCYITGWGKINHQGSSDHVLQEAKMPLVSNDNCALKFAASPGCQRLTITPQMLCSGNGGSNLRGCHGDSGGPYVCQSVKRNWVLQGVLSWVPPRCSAAERYTVFARVAKFRNWIDGKMRIKLVN